MTSVALQLASLLWRAGVLLVSRTRLFCYAACTTVGKPFLVPYYYYYYHYCVVLICPIALLGRFHTCTLAGPQAARINLSEIGTVAKLEKAGVGGTDTMMTARRAQTPLVVMIVE